MDSLTVLQWLTYFCVAFSLVMLFYRAYRIARLPVHLRWELYPVPHEKGKGRYGGSYLEEFEWWNKKREVSLFDEVKEMGEEIFFIKSLFNKNKGVWIFSYPFHLGLYLLIGFAGLLVLGAFLMLFNIDSTSGFGAIIQYLTVIAGIAGIILTLFGTVGLFLKRIFDYNLRLFSVLSDYFNLLVLMFIAGAMLVSWLNLDQSFTILRNYTNSLMTGSAFSTHGAVTVEIAAILFFIVYLPFTHMTHFIAKYFTYHQIRWNDEPNIKNGKLSKKIDKVLQYPVSWSASHIKGDGKKNWVDVATNMEENKDGE